MKTVNICIFASGSGSNAENIVKHFALHNKYKVQLILSNKNDAYVLTRAQILGIDSVVFSKNDLEHNNFVDDLLKRYKIDVIILAGFLLKVPQRLTEMYKGRILNIHPALLPSYGGKGMYGMNVHNAVISAGEKESGITIHIVDEKYDNGSIICQAKCKINHDDTPETLAEKIHSLEAEYFPVTIERFLDTIEIVEES